MLLIRLMGTVIWGALPMLAGICVLPLEADWIELENGSRIQGGYRKQRGRKVE